MSDITPSVWHQNNKGEWRLYFNADSDLVSSSLINPEKSKINNNSISEKNLLLGTLVMTPKGIGRFIRKNDDICTIQFKDEKKEEKFNINKISNNFNCLLFEICKGNTNINRLKLKAMGKVEDIFDELEKIKIINKKEDYSLIYNGMLLKKDFTFEQLNISNNCKMLLLLKKISTSTVSRFNTVNRYWFTYSIDGICFTPSEKIQLTGVGVYGSYENKTVMGTLKILDGPSFSSKIIYEQNVEIPPAQTNTEAVIKIHLSKPVKCKKEQEYSVLLYSNNLTNSYCGQGGKKMIEGENGVSFTFKRVIGRNCGTGIEAGNFPELYYFTH